MNDVDEAIAFRRAPDSSLKHSPYKARKDPWRPSPRSYPSHQTAILSGEEAQPYLPRLVVARGALVPPEVRGIQPGLVELEFLREALPCHGNRLLLEVIPEAPIPEHLKEGVMVHVLPHVVQVVVLPPGADAFLGIRRALQSAHG
jgi:hypothetical protein